MTQSNSPNRPFYRSDAWLRVIAAFKLLKASLLVLAGIAAIELLNDDVAEAVSRWAMTLTADRHYAVVEALVSRLLHVDHTTLKLLSFGTFLYAALFCAEGCGLYLDKRWAEYLTIVTTAGLIPFELYELVRNATQTKAKATVLIVNILIVAYLALRVSSKEEPVRSRDGERALGEA